MNNQKSLFDSSNEKKKMQKIYESVNEIFEEAITLKNGDQLAKYFEFLKNVPCHAPFNNTLVFLQNPNCSYFATKSQWKQRFDRTIKQNARPMVSMIPFGPVEFVYDVEDTEGKTITDKDFLYWWKKEGGTFNKSIFHNTMLNLEKIGITLKKETPKKYFNNPAYDTTKSDEFRKAGFACKYHNGILEIALHPRYNEPSTEAYSILCHEIAHMLLGHLGRIEIKDKKGKEKEFVYDRRNMAGINIKEIEAEITSWIVLSLLGIEDDKKTATYMASWICDKGDAQKINLTLVLKSAGKIQSMGKTGTRKNIDK